MILTPDGLENREDDEGKQKDERVNQERPFCLKLIFVIECLPDHDLCMVPKEDQTPPTHEEVRANWSSAHDDDFLPLNKSIGKAEERHESWGSSESIEVWPDRSEEDDDTIEEESKHQPLKDAHKEDADR